jgi:hypothetical protein
MSKSDKSQIICKCRMGTNVVYQKLFHITTDTTDDRTDI